MTNTPLLSERPIKHYECEFPVQTTAIFRWGWLVFWLLIAAAIWIGVIQWWLR